MSQKQGTSRCTGAWRWPALGLLAGVAGGLGAPLPAEAQSWSAARTAPALWQVVAVDRTGEPLWPYGREDVAGDGLSTFRSDEAQGDLRTFYADSDADDLWLRAYVSGSSAPADTTRALFFIDSDGNERTGGAARGSDIDDALGEDPTRGGYEWAIVVTGASTMAEVFRWQAGPGRWSAFDVRPAAQLSVESGLDVDPLGLGPSARGYLQVRVAHMASGLTASCAGNLFVRLLHAASAQRTFGDDAPDDVACRASEDPYGDPPVLRSYACADDRPCFADGSCRDGVCLFAYDCQRDADCRAGERCTAGKCVRTVTTSCTSSTQCDGLVCENGACVACSASGARACGGGLACSPNGACVDTGDFTPSDPSEPGGGSDDGQGRVEGGALHCAVHGARGSASRWTWLMLLGSAAMAVGRRATRRNRTQRGHHE